MKINHGPKSMSELFEASELHDSEFARLFEVLFDRVRKHAEWLIRTEFDSKSRMVVTRIGTQTDIAAVVVEDLLLMPRTEIKSRFTTGQLYSYVQTVARRKILDAIKIKTSFSELPASASLADFRDLTPVEQCQQNEILASYDKFMEWLEETNPNVFAVFQHKAIGDLTWIEIGEELGCSDRTAGVRYSKGIEMLRSNGFERFANFLAQK